MANVDAAYGFKYIGGPARFKVMTKLAAYGTAVGINDLVVWAGTNNNLQRGASAAAVLGTSLAYSALSTLATHPVIVALPDSLFVAQEDGIGGAAGVDAVGANASFIVTAACSSTTGLSQMEIDSNTVGTTNTLDLKIYKVAPYADNDGTAANAQFFVFLNNISMGTQIAGV